MFYLEDHNGFFWREDQGTVDDLDCATGYESEEEAQKRAATLLGKWTVYEDISE
jgi:hypothetical protein